MPSASRRAGWRPPWRSPGPGRFRPSSWPERDRPARTGGRPCLAWLASKPTPWSRTATATAPSSASTRISIGRPSPCSMALTEQVAQNPLHPAHVDLGSARARRMDRHLAPGLRRRTRHDPRPASHHPAQVDIGSNVRTAAPASKREISSRSESNDSKRSSSVCSSSADRRDRVEILARLVQHFGRHPYGRQRCPQLMGHVGDEPLLHARQVFQLRDLLLQLRGHVVHRRGQTGEVVFSPDLHPVVQVARRELSAARRAAAHGDDDLPCHQCGDERRQDHQQRAPVLTAAGRRNVSVSTSCLSGKMK